MQFEFEFLVLIWQLFGAGTEQTGRKHLLGRLFSLGVHGVHRLSRNHWAILETASIHCD